LVVRHLAAQTAWLDTSPLWHEGRVCWPFRLGTQTRWLPADPAELAAAERALNKIANYPRALETTLGTDQQSGGVWLQARRRKLETVKILARLEAPDLPLLARSSHSRNPATLTRLIELLLAEALCRNALPHSPTIILSRWPNDISQELIAICADENQASEVRLLAAIILGARNEDQDEQQNDLPGKNQCDVYHGWQWGRSFGLSAVPGFVARLLAADNSGALARRFEKARPLTQKIGCPFDFWADIFAERPVPDAVQLMEAFASCESIVWQTPSSQLSPALQALMAQLREKQCEVQGKFCRLLCEFARQGDAATIESLRLFVEASWHIETPLALWAAPSSQWQAQRGNPLLWPLLHQKASRHLLFILREVLKLPPNKHGAAFRVLKENVPSIWNEDSLKASSPRHDISRQVKNWLDKRWNKKGKPLLRLISQVSEQTARRALAMNALRILRNRTWRDEALAEWAFDIAETLATESHDAASHLDDLFDLLEEYPNLAAAQDELAWLFEVLRGEKYRGAVARSMVIHLGWTNKSQRNARQMPHYLPAIAALKSLDEVWDVARFANAASLLDREMRAGARRQFLEQQQLKPSKNEADFDEEIFEEPPDATEETARWLEWMAAEILRTRTGSSDEDDPVVYYDLEDATLLSWILSGGDFALFQKLFNVAVRHDFSSLETMGQAARSLQKYPAATTALGYLFSIQPGRLTALLKRWGLTRRLGDVQKPLEVFREMPTAVPLVYRELLQLVPELWQEAALLAHAQNLRGQPLSLPSGLRHVLAMPHKMQSEHAHLAARYQQTPRDDWAARLAMLDKRLENRSELQRVMAGEIREKLPEIAARTMLEAIEQQVSECYRARLREVAGPLPASLELDENWMNAILLTGDIQYNRKLLRNLLRALAHGEDDWPGKHPANVKFLQDLEARNVKTRVWCGIMPRRFEGERGTCHLRLERHPLAILQMGNYFDTCLSFGGINSFSTVANACELNKRVIFARDDKGRVVGRKLIGLNEDGKLIGFYTYTSLQDTEANQELRRCFTRYCEIFAERCGLEMAEEGTIPRLFAEQWYDDGVVRWRGEDEETPRQTNIAG
jgi:hypothetical protein